MFHVLEVIVYHVPMVCAQCAKRIMFLLRRVVLIQLEVIVRRVVLFCTVLNVMAMNVRYVTMAIRLTCLMAENMVFHHIAVHALPFLRIAVHVKLVLRNVSRAKTTIRLMMTNVIYALRSSRTVPCVRRHPTNAKNVFQDTY